MGKEKSFLHSLMTTGVSVLLFADFVEHLLFLYWVTFEQLPIYLFFLIIGVFKKGVLHTFD